MCLCVSVCWLDCWSARLSLSLVSSPPLATLLHAIFPSLILAHPLFAHRCRYRYRLLVVFDFRLSIVSWGSRLLLRDGSACAFACPGKSGLHPCDLRPFFFCLIVCYYDPIWRSSSRFYRLHRVDGSHIFFILSLLFFFFRGFAKKKEELERDLW